MKLITNKDNKTKRAAISCVTNRDFSYLNKPTRHAIQTLHVILEYMIKKN